VSMVLYAKVVGAGSSKGLSSFTAAGQQLAEVGGRRLDRRGVLMTRVARNVECARSYVIRASEDWAFYVDDEAFDEL